MRADTARMSGLPSHYENLGSCLSKVSRTRREGLTVERLLHMIQNLNAAFHERALGLHSCPTLYSGSSQSASNPPSHINVQVEGDMLSP